MFNAYIPKIYMLISSLTQAAPFCAGRLLQKCCAVLVFFFCL